MRLFFAIWPGEAALGKLVELAERVAESSGGRASPPGNIHLTLEFLGEVADDRLPALQAIGAGVSTRSFRLELDRLGAFRRARVAWAGCETVPRKLLELQSTLAKALHVAGFELEDRPFAAHVTLAHKIERPPAFEAIEPIQWTVREFTLVRSQAGRYARIAAWRLQP
ncbi:MAG TPA: RNA 2',3'-cyclic phosphodiesterase [Usitatibacter sp.]|nr:RNA 2',3'-cyclic phosphodiesterase [Usitatibacter sp.]